MSTQRDVSTVIRTIREEWQEEYGVTPRSINRGECLVFACEVVNECDYVAMKRTGDEDVLGPPENPQRDMEPFHVWVFDGEQHYDAEVPDGVPHWRALPFFQRTGYGRDTDT